MDSELLNFLEMLVLMAHQQVLFAQVIMVEFNCLFLDQYSLCGWEFPFLVVQLQLTLTELSKVMVALPLFDQQV